MSYARCSASSGETAQKERAQPCRIRRPTVRVFDRLQVASDRHQGRLASSGLDTAIAAFERPEDAVRAGLVLLAELSDERLAPCSLVLHRGPAVTTRIDDRMAYYGRTLVRALALSVSAPPRRWVVSSAALGDDAARITQAAGVSSTLHPAPLLGPAQWCLYVESAPKAQPEALRRAEPTLRGSEYPAAR